MKLPSPFSARRVTLRAPPAWHARQDIKIAHVYGKTGALEAYAKQTPGRLMLGLEYATGGTMTVNGRKIVDHRERITRASPTSRSQCSLPRYGDDKVDLADRPDLVALGAGACCPVAEEYKKVLLVEPCRSPTRSPATSGTATSSAPGAARRRTRLPAPSRCPRTRRSRCWRRTTRSAATA
jgi:hypothetical protein